MPNLVPTRLLAGLAAVALACAGATVATPAAAADGPLTITSVEAENNGGGLSAHIPVACAVAVEFTDGTPAAARSYKLSVRDADGTLLDSKRGAFDPYGDLSELRFTLPCDSFPEGDPATVSVDELGAGGAAVETDSADPYTFAYTGHPTGIYNSSVKRDGHWTNFVGKPATITFTGGEWDPGTRFTTRVVTSKTRKYTATDDSDNWLRGAAILKDVESDAPVLTWTPRPRDAGRWVWTSIVGTAPGKGAWTFWFAPEYIAPGTQPRAAWYDGFGAKQGSAKVGRTIKVTAPVLTAAGTKARAKATYKWHVKQRSWKPLTGGASTKSSLRLTPAMRGKQVRATVTYKAPGYRSFAKSFVWSKVQR